MVNFNSKTQVKFWVYKRYLTHIMLSYLLASKFLHNCDGKPKLLLLTPSAGNKQK